MSKDSKGIVKGMKFTTLHDYPSQLKAQEARQRVQLRNIRNYLSSLVNSSQTWYIYAYLRLFNII